MSSKTISYNYVIWYMRDMIVDYGPMYTGNEKYNYFIDKYINNVLSVAINAERNGTVVKTDDVSSIVKKRNGQIDCYATIRKYLSNFDLDQLFSIREQFKTEWQWKMKYF